MISLITFVELRSMEGHNSKRPRSSINSSSGAMNFIDDEQNQQQQQQQQRARTSGGNNTALVGIRSEILKEEGDYCYPDVPEVDGIHHQQQEQQQQQQEQQEQHQEHDRSKTFPDYGHLLGPVSSEYGRRLGQWNSHSESLSADYPERYKRLGAGGDDPEAGAGPDERRVRSRSEVSVLSDLLGRRDDQTELHMNISARTLRPSGGKDRHSKVFTAKGPRDRRVRLSVSTAIQFYDVQDRLGYDQPSKAVEWLMKKAKDAIDELSQIPLPGIDRLTFPGTAFGSSHGFGALSGSSIGHDSQFVAGTSFASGSDRVIEAGLLAEEMENRAPEVKVLCSSSRAGQQQRQAVDESDSFARQRREEDLGADIAISVGECGSSRTTAARGAAAAFGAGQISSNTVLQAASCQLPQQPQQHRDWKNSLQPNPTSNSSSGGSYTLYDDPSSSLADHQQHHHQHHQHQQQHHHHQQQQRLELFQTPVAVQYHQQHHHPHHHHQQTTSLITVHQTYLQQQDFLHNSNSFVAGGGGSSSSSPAGQQSIAKPALDHFHSLKIASSAAAAAASAAGTSQPENVSSTSLRFPSSFLGSPFQQQQHQQNQQQPQRAPSPSVQFDSSQQEFPAKFHGLERRGSKRRD